MTQQTDKAGRYFITPEEFAKITNLSRQTVTVFLREGRLPGLKFGSAWRVEMPKALESSHE